NIQKARLRAAEAERDKAEIELYKAQIKPHFMFNTLNSLYGLFLTQDNNALPSLEKFISMMRYIHTSSNRDLVPISEEAEYIREYVEVQSLRLNEMTSVNLNIDIRNDSLLIPPMLLVTFVENCFKHGVSPIERSNITVELTEKQRHLVFYTRNRIFPVRRIGEHMGIENCRKRLELLYPGRHRMEISDDGKYYQVNLNIDL
ncbi:MAG: histidine kinase, partial [Muribaculaceae bacterium]|nr:histidine kinase [Muribaculaceae bacterium]